MRISRLLIGPQKLSGVRRASAYVAISVIVITAWFVRERPIAADAPPAPERYDIAVFKDVMITMRDGVRLALDIYRPAVNGLPVDGKFLVIMERTLIDVDPPNHDFPAGIDLNIGDSIVRARYRNSLEHTTMMTPGEVYPFTIELYPTSLVFQKGHRIRLDISSSNFPRFDVNPNTGEPLNNNRRWAIAVNTIYHDGPRPSQIVLPIIPADSTTH